MKLATWNVNGIRARQAQVQEWIERERPDVVCLQEIKATVRSGCRRSSARWRATGATGTAAKAIRASRSTSARRSRPSGRRSLILRSTTRTASPRSTDSAMLTVASVYVPERRQGLPRQDAVPRGDGRVRRVVSGERHSRSSLMRRHERRAHRARRASEGAQAARDRPAAGRARADRAHPRAAASSTSAGRSIPTTTACSPGGRRGATCGSATSGGGSTTSSRATALAARATACPVQKDVGTSDHAPVVATFAD